MSDQPSPSQPSKAPGFSLGRRFYFIPASLVAVIASLIAFRQEPRPDPLTSPPLFSVAWWKYPLEINPVRRLTFITSNIRDITLAPDNTLWIAGGGGLLASSTDGGQTWRLHEIFGPNASVTNTSSPPLNYPSATPSPNPSLQYSPSPGASRTPPQEKSARTEEKDDYRQAAFSPDETQTSVTPRRQSQAQTQAPPEKTIPQKIRTPTPTPPPQRTVEPTPVPQTAVTPTTTSQTTVAPTTTPQTTPAPTLSTSPREESSGRIFPDLEAVAFYDAQRGCAVGQSGAVVWTSDGGNTWRAQDLLDPLSLIAVRFEAADRITALAENGLFCYASEGAGRGYIPGGLPSGGGFVSAFLGGSDAWGETGSAIFRARLPSATGWSKTELTPPVFITLGDGLGFIGWAGTHERSAKMRVFAQQPAAAPSVPSNVSSILFPKNASEAWGVGAKGTIMKTTDAGKSWITLASWPSAELAKQWQEAGKHRRFPAPWFYVACLVSLGLCIPVLRRPSNVVVEGSVADMLTSDRPIEPGEPDPLQFNAIALALSRFLRNSNTTPPLTIAITGEWGTGKSSLMNLLRGDLRARRFRPVWFNPWHHQKEEHLLAALLENIQAQAIPAIFSFQGFCYRISLVWFRARRYWRVSLFLGVLVAGLAGYFAVEPSRMDRVANELRGFTTAVGGFIEKCFKTEDPKKADTNPAPASENKSPGPAALLFVSSVIGSIVALIKALRSFGVDPASLLATSADRPRLRDLKAETSFRYKFARQFADVTRALHAFNRRTMLILIDDLDRCRPESVVEMLEAVNFLITCGDCFIVIGMARDRVERCVGLAFKDMAEEVFGRVTGAPNQQEEERKERRSEYARQYLEKLINIEVPVPEATSDQSRELLARDEAEEVRRRARQQQYRKLARAALLTGMALLILGSAFFAGKILFPKSFVRAPFTAPLTANEWQNIVREQNSSVEAPGSKPMSSPASLESATPAATGAWTVWLLVAALLAAGVWTLFLLPADIVYDSAEFTKALRRWQPIISRKRNTPRSLKRFLNRVRYLAMKQRVAEPVRSRWQTFLAKFFPRFAAPPQKTAVPPDGFIAEDILVGLCACKYLFPDKAIGSAVHLVEEELNSQTRPVSPAEQELLRYVKGDFSRRVDQSQENFEKLHAGLHVY
jgi:KAP family P-loop domain